MPKGEKSDAAVFKKPEKPIKGILKKTQTETDKSAKKKEVIAEKVVEAAKKKTAAPAPKEKPAAAEKPNTKKTVAPAPTKGNKDEESSSSSFHFDEESESHSESASHSASTSEISSSVTDEFKKNKLEIALDDATTKKLTETLEKKKKPIDQIKISDPRGVIFLGHLPYGFFEPQMKAFFAQFGVVTRIKLSRNKKTGKSKHYAFVEFLDEIVAQIVADTMDGYMMFHRVLKCKVIPPEKVHPKMFHGANKRFVPKPTQAMHKKAVNKRRTPEERAKSIDKLLSKEQAKREKLAASGIDYDFPGYAKEAAEENKKKTPAAEEPKGAPAAKKAKK